MGWIFTDRDLGLTSDTNSNQKINKDPEYPDQPHCLYKDLQIC